MTNTLKTLHTILDRNGRSECCGSWINDGECWACLKAATPNDHQTGRFETVITTVGNPDFQQYAPITDPILVSATSMHDLVNRVRNVQNTWQIGGGNWTNPQVKQDSRRVGFMSYNGRIWNKKNWDSSAVEVGIA